MFGCGLILVYVVFGNFAVLVLVYRCCLLGVVLVLYGCCFACAGLL